MNLSKTLYGLTACLFAASLSGCVIESSSPPPVYYGSITVDVSIEGSQHPSECAFANADQIEVTILDGAGVVTTVTTPCDTFGLTIDRLPEGTYEAEVMLLDAFGHVVSDTLVFPGADVVANTDLRIDADFPTSSLH